MIRHLGSRYYFSFDVKYPRQLIRDVKLGNGRLCLGVRLCNLRDCFSFIYQTKFWC
jgi:hypothetical protein